MPWMVYKASIYFQQEMSVLAGAKRGNGQGFTGDKWHNWNDKGGIDKPGPDIECFSSKGFVNIPDVNVLILQGASNSTGSN